MVYGSRLFPSKLTRYCVGLPQPRHLLLGLLGAFLSDSLVEMRSYIYTQAVAIGMVASLIRPQRWITSQ